MHNRRIRRITNDRGAGNVLRVGSAVGNRGAPGVRRLPAICKLILDDDRVRAICIVRGRGDFGRAAEHRGGCSVSGGGRVHSGGGCDLDRDSIAERGLAGLGAGQSAADLNRVFLAQGASHHGIAQLERLRVRAEDVGPDVLRRLDLPLIGIVLGGRLCLCRQADLLVHREVNTLDGLAAAVANSQAVRHARAEEQAHAQEHGCAEDERENAFFHVFVLLSQAVGIGSICVLEVLASTVPTCFHASMGPYLSRFAVWTASAVT